MIRKFMSIFVVVAAVGSLALAGCAPKSAPTPSPAPAQVYEFKFAHHFPTGSVIGENNCTWYINRVQELGKGQIKIKEFPGGQLGSVQEELGLVQSGTVDIAPIVHILFAGELPLMSYDQVPFMVKSIKQRLDLRRYMEANVPELQSIWEKYNQYPLYRWTTDEDVISTKTPVRTPVDMKGLKFRCGGGIQVLIMDALGAVAMSVNPGETYLTLQTGVLGGTYGPASLDRDYKWYEVCPNITVMSQAPSGTAGVFTINLNRWNSLPQHIKDIMIQAAEDNDAHLAEAWPKQQAKVLDDMTKAGANAIRLTDTETQKFKDAVSNVEAAWLKQHPEQKKVIEMAKAWVAEHPE